MRIEPLGDETYILRDLPCAPYQLADRLNAVLPAGLIEASASYETVGLYVDPDRFDVTAVDRLLDEVSEPYEQKLLQIPVWFCGEDFEEVASFLELSGDDLINAFCEPTYQCFAIGFCPGFPYLGYLPGALQGVARLASPRPRVPAGSVAITGAQAGIYPKDHPGGWRILGRTPLTIADEKTDYFPISAGNRVQFAPIDAAEFQARRGQLL